MEPKFGPYEKSDEVVRISDARNFCFDTSLSFLSEMKFAYKSEI